MEANTPAAAGASPLDAGAIEAAARETGDTSRQLADGLVGLGLTYLTLAGLGAVLSTQAPERALRNAVVIGLLGVSGGFARVAGGRLRGAPDLAWAWAGCLSLAAAWLVWICSANVASSVPFLLGTVWTITRARRLGLALDRLQRHRSVQGLRSSIAAKLPRSPAGPAPTTFAVRTTGATGAEAPSVDWRLVWLVAGPLFLYILFRALAS